MYLDRAVADAMRMQNDLRSAFAGAQRSGRRHYHYTSIMAVPAIYDAGCLKRSDPDRLVYFTRREHWDPAAARSVLRPGQDHHVLMSFEEQAQTIGHARFVLVNDQVQLYGFDLIEEVFPEMAAFTRHHAVKMGSDVADWAVCPADVALKDLRLELFLDKKWKPVPVPQVAQMCRAAAARYNMGCLSRGGELESTPLIKHLRAQFRLDWNGIHGANHWARVKRHGLKLGKLRGANLLLVELFALLHDSCRESDTSDPEHGARAAELAASLNGKFYDITPRQLDTLCTAIRGHSGGSVDADPTVQTCWDADRLDLGRIGVMPNPDFLSVHAAPLIADAWTWSRGGKAPQT